MTSAYSTDLKLELMVTGENAGTWGDKTNTNLNLVQQAIAGFEQVTLSSGGTLALAMNNGALSNARNMVVKFATASIASSTVCTIPDGIEKFYIFDCTGLTNPTNLTIKTASGTGFVPDRAAIFAAYADGTNLKEISLDTLGGSLGTVGIADDAITAAKISNNAVVTAGILQSNVTQNKLATNAVGTAQILQSNVTLTKMAANSVGPSQLQSTAVTAGSYTNASITVDEDGRLTAASAGAAGATNYLPIKFDTSPGTYTPTPTATKIMVGVCGGGGGGGRGGTSRDGKGGGTGGYGLYVTTNTGPHAYVIGAAGSAKGPGGGTAPSGNGTSFGSFAVTGGSGGSSYSPPGSPNGTPGTAPGATFLLSPGITTDNQLRHMFQNGTNNGNGANNVGPSPSSQSGNPGFIHVFENVEPS